MEGEGTEDKFVIMFEELLRKDIDPNPKQRLLLLLLLLLLEPERNSTTTLSRIGMNQMPREGDFSSSLFAFISTYRNE